jgi:hypothetical protein
MGAQCECIEFQVRRVSVRIVVAAYPSAINAIRLPRPVGAETILHHNPASIHTGSIHIVGQVIAQRIAVEERTVAERHNDLVLLKLSESRSAGSGVEQVNGDDIWLGLDFRL